MRAFIQTSKGFSIEEKRENLYGDIVSPRLAPRHGRTEEDSWCRRVKWAGRPRGWRKHTSGQVVPLVSLATFFTGDVAQRYDDQDRNSDTHTYADPDDLLVYTTVALSWKHLQFISKLPVTHICSKTTFLKFTSGEFENISHTFSSKFSLNKMNFL